MIWELRVFEGGKLMEIGKMAEWQAADLIKRIKTETAERYVDRHKAFDAAIAALEEIQWYRGLGTVEECRRAMEKQKPKKPIDDTAFGVCPNCHNEFNSELVNEYDIKHCIYCGQAIDIKNYYLPKIIEGKISNTGWPIDGHTLILTSWDYDNYESWHLYKWKPEDERAVIETVFITETEAGMCLYDTLEEFAERWKEWEPEGSFCIPLENVEVIKVLQEERKEND